MYMYLIYKNNANWTSKFRRYPGPCKHCILCFYTSFYPHPLNKRYVLCSTLSIAWVVIYAMYVSNIMLVHVSQSKDIGIT